MQIEGLAVCLFGLESCVSHELKDMNITPTVVTDGRVYFIADERDIVRANLKLRTAERVYVRMASFKAETFEELYQGVKSIPLDKYLPKDAAFPISKATSLKSTLHSLPSIQSISKKAMIDKMKIIYGEDTIFKETGVKYPIHVFLYKNTADILLDTSGESLHKRGYRAKSSIAPIRETLAAAMVMLSPWKRGRILIDPMCGSGTVVIEAALIGANIAPGINRNFIGEQFDFLPKKIWVEERKAALETEISDPFTIYGSDIDKSVLKIAQTNAGYAGVSDFIKFENKDISSIRSDEEYGFLITNPPYGKRIGDKQKIEEIYSKIKKCTYRLKNWSYFVITDYAEIEKTLGKKASKKRKLYNGMIKTNYYSFLGKKPENIKGD